MQNRTPVRFFAAFLSVNALCWTIVPALTRKILPLDTLEAIVWGASPNFGNGKHPPLSGWIAEFFYTAFGYTDFSQYLLSQLLILTGFIAVYFLGRLFLSRTESIIGSLILYCICFYNLTSPEYNVNVLEIAFWPITAWVFYRAVCDNKIRQWLLFGVCAAVIMWTKYFGGLLLFTLFVYMLIDAKARSRFLAVGPYLALALFGILYLPHVWWLHQHDYLPVLYAIGRAEKEEHFHLGIYLVKMLRLIPMIVGLLLPSAIVLWFSCGMINGKLLWQRFRKKWYGSENGSKFLLTLLVVPIAVLQLMAIAGIGVRTMWYQPIFFSAGPLLVCFFRPWIAQINWKRFAGSIICFALFYLGLFTTINLVHSSYRVHFQIDEYSRFFSGKIGNHDKKLILVGDYWSIGLLHCSLPKHPVAINAGDQAWEKDLDWAFQQLKEDEAVIVFASNKLSLLKKINQRYQLQIQPESRVFSGAAPFDKPDDVRFYYAILTKENIK
ncbi:MAG: glycosyltransferase family 39 protein [Victivallaceae bacterium]|nr:glycosyltransferase family 39 protein [Victivallaceae bacterium]